VQQIFCSPLGGGIRRHPKVRTRFATIGAEPLASTPEEYAADIDREETKMVLAYQITRVEGRVKSPFSESAHCRRARYPALVRRTF